MKRLDQRQTLCLDPQDAGLMRDSLSQVHLSGVKTSFALTFHLSETSADSLNHQH